MTTLHSAKVLGSHRDEECILCARWRKENQTKGTQSDNGLRRYVLDQINLRQGDDPRDELPKWVYLRDLMDGKATYPR
jgi:hypothetical protein